MTSAKTPKSLRDAIHAHAADPFRFPELISAWNTFFDAYTDPDFSAFESDAKKALSDIDAASDSDATSLQIQRMLAAFPSPVLVVRQDGTILRMNDCAMREISVDPGDNIDTVPISLIGGATISAQITSSLDGKGKHGTVVFRQAVHNRDDHNLTLAFISAQTVATPFTLVFVIDPQWQNAALAVVTEAFQLTGAETEVLQGLLRGHDILAIAKSRDTSRATVRTQMQTIMSKAGVSSQAELVRNALALTQFQVDIEQVAAVARHPHRKRFNLMRKGGRSVEVVLAGDMNGKLVVFVPDITVYSFSPTNEANLASHGLCFATVARPGYGGTDPAPEGEHDATMAADIVALQDQFGVTSSVLLAHSTATGYAFRLGGLIPDRLSSIVLLSTLPPMPYLIKRGIVSPWAGAVLRSGKTTPTLLRLMVAAGLRAWKAMGSRRFARMQLSDNPEDVVVCDQVELLTEMDAALAAATAQGVEVAVRDLSMATSDWTDWARACRTPAILFHGTKNPIAPVEVVRDFAKDFPERVTLVEVPEAGFMVAETHRSRLTELLLNA